MKALTLVMMIVIGQFASAATSPVIERYFRNNATAAKVGLAVENEGVKTTISLLSCSDISGLADDGNQYGVCTFEAHGFMIYGVYSVVVNPTGYEFAEAVLVGNFLP